MRHCPAVTSPGTAAASQDTSGDSGNTAAAEGQAEPHLPPGHCSKRSLLEPPSVPQEKLQPPRSQLPVNLSKGTGTATAFSCTAASSTSCCSLSLWTSPGFKRAGANFTCSTRAAQGSSAVTLSKCASGRAHTRLHTLLFDRNPSCFSSSSVSVWKAAPAPPCHP